MVLDPDGDQAGVSKRYTEGLRVVVHVETRWRTIVPRRERDSDENNHVYLAPRHRSSKPEISDVPANRDK